MEELKIEEFQPKKSLEDRYPIESIAFSEEEYYETLILQGYTEEKAKEYSKTKMLVYITKT